MFSTSFMGKGVFTFPNVKREFICLKPFINFLQFLINQREQKFLSPYAHKKDSCRLQTLLGKVLMNCADHSHTTGGVMISILSLAGPRNRYSQCYVSRLCVIEIYCILFVRQLRNQARLMPLIPYISSFLINVVRSCFNLVFKKFSYQSAVNGLAVLVGQRSEND